jgi:hypothetical protein
LFPSGVFQVSLNYNCSVQFWANQVSCPEEHSRGAVDIAAVVDFMYNAAVDTVVSVEVRSVLCDVLVAGTVVVSVAFVDAFQIHTTGKADITVLRCVVIMVSDVHELRTKFEAECCSDKYRSDECKVTTQERMSFNSDNGICELNAL